MCFTTQQHLEECHVQFSEPVSRSMFTDALLCMLVLPVNPTYVVAQYQFKRCPGTDLYFHK